METRKLAKYGLIYMATSLLIQLISILIVPVFTKNLTLEQFGQYNLLISLQAFLSVFVTLGIYSGMNRFLNEFPNKNRTKNTVLTFSIIWGVIVCVASYFLSESLYRFVFKGETGGGYYINMIVTSAVFLCLISIYVSYYTMQFKARTSSIINLGKTVLMFVFSTYFIVIRKDGLQGALQAQLITYGSVLIAVMLYDIKNIKLEFSKKELRIMLQYSIGLLPGDVSALVYTLIDRYFIKAILGLQLVAVYSMGYRIGMMMEPIFLSPFKSVFTSFKYKVYKEVDASEKIREIYVFYNFIGWFCLLGLSVFAKPAITLLSTAEYSDAFKVVPIIAFSYFLDGLGEFYSLGIHIKNKSLVGSFVLIVGAVINILLNIGLIPIFGITGAACATVLSYLIINVLNFVIGKRYLDLGLRYFDPFKGGILFLGLYGIYFASYSSINNMFFEVLLACFLCAFFIIFGIFIGLIPWKVVKTTILQLARKVGFTKFA